MRLPSIAVAVLFGVLPAARAQAVPAAAPAPSAPASAEVFGDGSDRPLFGFDVRVGGVAFDKDCWDDSVGGAVDFGLTVWEPGGVFGLWAGIGAQGASYVWEDDWGQVESDVLAMPVGASLLLRCPLGDVLALRGEVGARYVAMDIDDWDDDYYDRRRRHRHGDWDRYWHPDRYLDVDDTSLAVATVALEFDLDPAFIAVGAGWQFDLGKPEVEYLGERIGKVDLSGCCFFLDVGLVF